MHFEEMTMKANRPKWNIDIRATDWDPPAAVLHRVRLLSAVAQLLERVVLRFSFSCLILVSSSLRKKPFVKQYQPRRRLARPLLTTTTFVHAPCALKTTTRRASSHI